MLLCDISRPATLDAFSELPRKFCEICRSYQAEKTQKFNVFLCFFILAISNIFKSWLHQDAAQKQDRAAEPGELALKSCFRFVTTE